MLETLINGNLAIFKVTLERFLTASETLRPGGLFSIDANGFSDDLQFMQLRRVLVSALDKGDT